MAATLVYVYVKPEFVNAFINATHINHEHSILEPGNIRFDIMQDANQPTKFILYEVYQTDEAAAAHKTTAHYLAWRDTVGPWMAQPREGLKHILLYPDHH